MLFCAQVPYASGRSLPVLGGDRLCHRFQSFAGKTGSHVFVAILIPHLCVASLICTYEGVIHTCHRCPGGGRCDGQLLRLRLGHDGVGIPRQSPHSARRDAEAQTRSRSIPAFGSQSQ